MAALPLPSWLINSARTVAEVQQAWTDILTFISQRIGAASETTLTITSGSVTPTTGGHSVDTEGTAASDDLTNLVTSALEDGSLLLLRSANAGRTVVLKHAAGGAGQMSLKGAVDFTLDTTSKWIQLRRIGADWVEVFRSWGSDKAGERAWLGAAATVHTHTGVYEPADADILKGDTAGTLTAGFINTPEPLGNLGATTLVPDIRLGDTQVGTVTGTLVIDPPTYDGDIDLMLINDGTTQSVTLNASYVILSGTYTAGGTLKHSLFLRKRGAVITAEIQQVVAA